MPKQDHITATNRVKSAGVLKRIMDIFNAYKYKEEMTNNIFAPTRTLELFNHLKHHIPNHSIILADFDTFLTQPSGGLRGINAPMVTHKLKDPTKWDAFNDYLTPRGTADICFPTDFYFI